MAIEERETRRALRAALLFAGAYGLATGLITRHIDVFAAHVLHYSIGTLTVVSGIVAGAGFFGAATWGAAADRFGAKPIVTISTVLTALNPLFYALATARHPWPYLVGQVLGGIAGAGWAIGVPLLLLRPTFGGGDRVRALALFQATIGICSGVAPILGGTLLELTAGAGARTSYALLFVTSLLGRLAAVWLLRRVPDAGGERTRYVATVVLRVQSRRLVARLARRARAA